MTAILLAAAVSALGLAAPANGQAMDHSQHMRGMEKPAPAAKPKSPARKPEAKAPSRGSVKRTVPRAQHRGSPPAAATTNPSCSPEHAAMGHCTPRPATQPPAMAADPACAPEHAAMGNCQPKLPGAPDRTAQMASGGTALPAGNAPAPAAKEADYADRVWGREAMAPARAALRSEHGGATFSQFVLNLAEVRFREGRDGYAWDGEFWYGGDVDRLTVRSEGEGSFGESAQGELQLLYSRAVGPYFNLQAGIRQDLAPGPDRTYATVGVEGLAPYWFDVEGALFVSDKGDVLGRIEAYYDQRITQRLILQPRAELNLSAQGVPVSGLGSGVTDAELGLRLRYEIKRELAPYLGASWERSFGGTARLARAAQKRTGGFSLVAGVRTWF